MQNSAQCPHWMTDLWAKSADRGEGGEPETLAQHTWYVLERLNEFIRLRSSLPDELGVPRLWHILFWSAFIHDFGKAAQGFQNRLRGGKRWTHRHEVLSLAFVDWLSAGFTDDEIPWLVAAVVSHHKNASKIKRLYPPPDDEYPEDDPVIPLVAELSDETIRKLWRWLAECSTAWIKASHFDKLGVESIDFLAEEDAVSLVANQGADRVRYWLKMSRRFIDSLNKTSASYSTVIGTLTLRGYLMNADHSASSHLGALPHVEISQDLILDSRHIEFSRLYEHQKQANCAKGSVLLTAPTGSGKTEAALLWAANQSSIEQAPRLFYTLPYQASMNAMKLRLVETFGEKNVGLQHGRALLAQYRMEMENSDDDANPKTVAQKVKQAKNMAELNYPPVRIFSPYQMLKGPYQLTGYEKLLSDYHHALFIFDEIHAYEVTRLALILKTIEYLRENFNAKFMVMSATFPSLIKNWLKDVLGSPTEITASPQLFAEFQRHQLHLLEGDLQDDDNIARIVSDARAGKSVLVVCNIVAKAQSVYQQITDTLANNSIPVELLHGRFNVRDRLAKEQLVRESAGRDEAKRRPIVLVATQVVEVSLDIDLDTIYTDPAPLEALVQRFGRINRRRKQKDLAPVHVFKEPNDGQKIYDSVLVERTLTILNREDGKPINEGEIGKWLDEIYAGDVAKKWEADFRREADTFENACLKPLRAFESNRELTELFYRAFDGTEVLPASFRDEYEHLKQTEPIRAAELLVPISYGRLHQLRNLNRVMTGSDEYPQIIDVPYDDELGLDFSTLTKQTFGIG